MKNSIKMMVMFIITLLATAFGNSGVPKNKTEWIVLGVTVVGTLLFYIAQNWIKPSTSTIGNISVSDFIKGALIALSTGVSNWAGTVLAGVSVNWGTLWTAVLTVLLGYFIKTFATPAPKP